MVDRGHKDCLVLCMQQPSADLRSDGCAHWRAGNIHACMLTATSPAWPGLSECACHYKAGFMPAGAAADR